MIFNVVCVLLLTVWQQLKSLSGHSSPVEAVCFGRLEDVVAAGSLSGSLKIWDLEANKSLSNLVSWAMTYTRVEIRWVFHGDDDHRLHGSASTVLTANGQVNGRWRILTPDRIETHATKFRAIDYVRERTPETKFGTNPSTEGFWVKYNVFVPFLFIYTFFLRLACRSDRLMDFYTR